VFVVVTFKTAMPLRQTMCFESVYEPALQLDLEEKRGMLARAYAVWMFVDGQLAGETYAVSLADLDDEPDVADDKDPRTAYCYSMTILPAFQGRGLSKVLGAYQLGQLKTAGFTTLTGHATDPRMVSSRAFFGAMFSVTHERWYGTDRTARFYRLPLN
jgi:GNAT superfamily N-acetyltransferase